MRALPLAGLAWLSGCATTGTHVAPQLVPAADVIRQVKYEIGKFAAETSAPITTPGTCLSQFALTIDRADIELTTTTSRTTGVSAGVEVPLNLGKIGGGASLSESVGSLQSLKLALIPQPGSFDAAAEPPRRVWQGEPFYRAMMDVRTALIAAADQRPCVTFDAEHDNSVAFGFTADRKVGANGGISLLFFTLGAERSNSGSAAHSITLHFVAPRSVSIVAPH